MNLSVREIGDTADVVDVEMRRDDVADVVAGETKAFDLADGGLLDVETRPQQEARRTDPARFGAVRHTETRVDEHQATGTLDQQDVTDRGNPGESIVPQLRWCTLIIRLPGPEGTAC